MSQGFVLDASVAAKWYLDDEELVGIARNFLIRFFTKEIEFHAPELLRYELGHILYKAQRPFQARISRKNCASFYRTFSRLPIKFHSLSNEELQQVLEFANRFNKSFYDCCYMWLAEKLNCQWLTSDEKYGKNIPDGFPEERILLLSSLQ